MAASVPAGTWRRRWPPAPHAQWSGRCSPAPTKRRARPSSTRVAATNPTAAWDPPERWRAAPPTARLQAAIEILDEVIASVRNDGPPADSIVTRYFKHRRYAGSKDRRAVRELVFRAIRRSAEEPPSGRAAVLGLARDEPALLE